MKSKKIIIAICTGIVLSGIVCSHALNVSAVGEEIQNEIKIAEELEWISASSGYMEVYKNQIYDGSPITINGKTYSENCIGTHSAYADWDKYIEYDVSNYSNYYDSFDVYVAQPDSGNNEVNFRVVVDGVEKTSIIWRKSPGGNEGYHQFSYYPVRLNTNIKGAQSIKLYADATTYGIENGVAAWINPRLYNASNSERVWASDVLDVKNNASTTGWNYGSGFVPMLDAKVNGDPISFVSGQKYDKGIGIQLKGDPFTYSDYENDKNNENGYVWLRWNIEDKNYSLFSTLVEMDSSNGCHVDAWIDGKEVYKSGFINSNANVADVNSAQRIVNIEIPQQAKTLELRIIAANGFGNGLVNLCNAAFYKRSNKLISMNAEEKPADVLPYYQARGTVFSSIPVELYDSASSSGVVVEDGIYMCAGDNLTRAKYEVNLKGTNYNTFSTKVGLFNSENVLNNGTDRIFNAIIGYEDGTQKVYSSNPINKQNSGSIFTFDFDSANAEYIDLYVSGELAYSESVWAEATLGRKYIVKFEVNGDVVSKTYEDGEKLVPIKPVVPNGYTILGWKLKGENNAFNFANADVTSDMYFEAILQANTYDITYKQQLEDGDLTNVTYQPANYVFNGKLDLPTAENIDGYTFAGWYFNGNKVLEVPTNITDGVELVAKYNRNIYTVNFEGVEEQSQTINHGDKVVKPSNPVKEGYTFAGWFVNDKEYNFESEVVTNLTIIAKFTRITYTVNFEGVEEQSQTINHGDKVVKPSNPVKEGYTFVGWFVNDTEYNFENEVVADLTITAKFTRITYTVTFEGVNEQSQTVNHGDKIVKPSDPVKEGYTFEGWFVNDKEYNFESEVVTNLTITAKFRKNEDPIPEKKGCKGEAQSSFVLGMMVAILYVIMFTKRETHTHEKRMIITK